MKILLVEDDERNMKLLEIKLLPMNYTLLKSTDGKNALKTLKLNPDIDLILLDIMMSDMDGYEVCSAIKSDTEFKDIPIIFITALDDEESQVKGLKYGAADYITKPFKFEILAARVNTQLELKKSRDVLKRTLKELNDALAKIKILKSFLPVCANCKRIRDDDAGGGWTALDSYVMNHTDSKVSHCICPDCIKKLYPDLKVLDATEFKG